MFETTVDTFTDYRGKVTRTTYNIDPKVETITIEGVQVDIVEHIRVDAETHKVTVVDYEAFKTGAYRIVRPAREAFTYCGDQQTSDRQSYAQALNTWHRADHLARCKTRKAAEASARRRLAEDHLIEQYGAEARRILRRLTGDQFKALPMLDGAPTVGQQIAIYGTGQYRVAIVIKVTPTKVEAIYSTPSSPQAVNKATAKHSEVRAFRANPTVVAPADVEDDDPARALAAAQAAAEQQLVDMGAALDAKHAAGVADILTRAGLTDDAGDDAGDGAAPARECGKDLPRWPFGACTEAEGHPGDCDRRATHRPREADKRAAVAALQRELSHPAMVAALADGLVRVDPLAEQHDRDRHSSDYWETATAGLPREAAFTPPADAAPPAPRWTVIYDDPKRTGGPSHSLHRKGCADVARAEGHPGVWTFDVCTDTIEQALIVAQYDGAQAPDPARDLGAVAVAPCAAAAGLLVAPPQALDPARDLGAVAVAPCAAAAGLLLAPPAGGELCEGLDCPAGCPGPHHPGIPSPTAQDGASERDRVSALDRHGKVWAVERRGNRVRITAAGAPGQWIDSVAVRAASPIDLYDRMVGTIDAFLTQVGLPALAVGGGWLRLDDQVDGAGDLVRPRRALQAALSEVDARHARAAHRDGHDEPCQNAQDIAAVRIVVGRAAIDGRLPVTAGEAEAVHRVAMRGVALWRRTGQAQEWLTALDMVAAGAGVLVARQPSTV